MAKWNLDDLNDTMTKYQAVREHVRKKLEGLYAFRDQQQSDGLWVSADTDRTIRTYEVIWGMIR